MSTPYWTYAAPAALSPQGGATDSPELSPASSDVQLSPGKQKFSGLVPRCWSAVRRLLTAEKSARKQLRVCETAALGDKRFVAVIQVDEERFLIGGAPNSVALLARLSQPAALPSLSTQQQSEKSRQQQ